MPELAIRAVDISDIADGGALREWLADRDARFVLVRPDFYVFGTADDNVRALLDRLREAIAVRQVHQRETVA